jgi:hypothetical protein
LDAYPRVFISELLLEEFSKELKSRIEALIDGFSPEILSSDQLVVSGSVFGPLSHEVYQEIRNESEYAAWVYAFGYRANHFTISMNSLKNYTTLQKLNGFLKDKGFHLNAAGGEIKTTRRIFSEMSGPDVGRSCNGHIACRVIGLPVVFDRELGWDRRQGYS